MRGQQRGPGECVAGDLLRRKFLSTVPENFIMILFVIHVVTNLMSMCVIQQRNSLSGYDWRLAEGWELTAEKGGL